MTVKARLVKHTLGLTIFLAAFLTGLIPVGILALLSFPTPEIDSVTPVLQDVREYQPRNRCKPDPLMLGLHVNEYRALQLNTTAVGTIEDTLILKRVLRETFRERRYHGVLNESGEVEMTIVIVPEKQVSGFELIAVVDALKAVDAGPIFIDRRGVPVRFSFCSKGGWQMDRIYCPFE